MLVSVLLVEIEAESKAGQAVEPDREMHDISAVLAGLSGRGVRDS